MTNIHRRSSLTGFIPLALFGACQLVNASYYHPAPPPAPDFSREDIAPNTIFNPSITQCLSSGDDATINRALQSGGPGTTVQLCPGANFNIKNPIYFYHPNQELSTWGYPTDNTRATLSVTGSQQSVAVVGYNFDGLDNCRLRNVQINGNRPALGRLNNGGALIEMGGKSTGQIIDNVRVFEPRGWSALHAAEGAGLVCQRIRITNNAVGPSGNAPMNAVQFTKAITSKLLAGPTMVGKRFVPTQGTSPPGQWADGISLACNNAVVTGNTITDATDGGIVIFGAPGSQVSGNTIIAATRDLLGGINMVDYGPFNGAYDGTQVFNNVLRTTGAMIKVGIAQGIMTWGSNNNPSFYVRNGQVYGNAFQSDPGSATAGYVNAFTANNNLGSARFGGVPSRACLTDVPPPPPKALTRDPSTSSGNFQPGTANDRIAFLICIMRADYAQGIARLSSNTTSSSDTNSESSSDTNSDAADDTSSEGSGDTHSEESGDTSSESSGNTNNLGSTGDKNDSGSGAPSESETEQADGTSDDDTRVESDDGSSDSNATETD